MQCVIQHRVADRVLPGGELGFLGAHLGPKGHSRQI